MAWSKVSNKYRKPLKWWFYKVLCELAWLFGDRGKYYYKYLNLCIKQGYNIYGERIVNG